MLQRVLKEHTFFLQPKNIRLKIRDITSLTTAIQNKNEGCQLPPGLKQCHPLEPGDRKHGGFVWFMMIAGAITSKYQLANDQELTAANYHP